MNLAENKKFYLQYEALEEYETGIELLGLEVKSIKAGHMVLEGARVLVRGGEAFLVGATVPPYQVNNTPADYDPTRVRRLLLTRKQIVELYDQGEQRGLTIVPISVYNKHNLIKLKIAVARGKKKYDKRQDIKKRDVEREIGRTLKR
ncbi:MAG: SsrA-binding protein SmpB [Candidatus Paceibacterota bacterium]|jgi:SsrA-binding protein